MLSSAVALRKLAVVRNIFVLHVIHHSLDDLDLTAFLKSDPEIYAAFCNIFPGKSHLIAAAVQSALTGFGNTCVRLRISLKRSKSGIAIELYHKLVFSRT